MRFSLRNTPASYLPAAGGKPGGGQMSRVMPLITALIALGGVLIGAGIQHFYTLRQQNLGNLQELRANAYLNFFQGQAKLLESEETRSRGNAREAERLLSEYRLLVKDARFRIGIFGGGSVVSALSKYFGRNPSLLPCPEGWKD